MMRWVGKRVDSGLRAAAMTLVVLCSSSQAQPPAPAAPSFVPGEILVKFKPGTTTESASSVISTFGMQPVQLFPELDVHRCRLPEGTDVEAALRACKGDATIAFAEPNYIYFASRLPNDPRFAELWGLQNDDDFDIDAPEAWEAQTGLPEVLVAIIDTGVDYNHEDLRANAWRNPGEIGNGRETNRTDDDSNGFVDDVFGWDFAGKDNDPMDDNGHGSHVAGTIAAAGNNGVGVVGVNWRTSIMALKFLSANGSGNAADAIDCILYAARNGARVLNNSWGGGGFSQALRDAIEFSRTRNAVFVAAAGNEGRDNDRSPSYPASYDVDNVMSIAACDREGQLATFSNFGRTSVDLAAPGVDILSTTPGNTYSAFSGTSMATPHASGVAALVIAHFPQSTYRQVMIRLAGSVDPAAPFEDTTWNGGRLNAAAALSAAPQVAFVTRAEASVNPEGPYRIDAEAIDDGSIQSVRLSYAVGGGSPTAVEMQSVAENAYRAEIPGQPAGSQVSYFVDVADDAGNTARSRTYRFQVGGNAGAPGCSPISLPSTMSVQARVLSVLVNVLLILLAVQGARKLIAKRSNSATKL